MIGIFDSGVGGLSVWKELYALMPEEDYTYFSDGAFCPYGPKPADIVCKRSVAITDFLLSKKASMIVVACNTATAASIGYLRSHYNIPFVGMEPAVKPAVMHSKSGVVGVLATAGTLKGQIYHKTLEDFASGIKVVEQVGTGLVELVENGNAASDEAYRLVSKYVRPMVEAGADNIVLGCTHYPFLMDAVRRAAGPGVEIVNPAPSVALQARRMLLCHSPKGRKGHSAFYSSSETSVMSGMVRFIAPDIGCSFSGNIVI